MACRQTEYAKKLKAELVKSMGGICALCGENNPEKLEFDHKDGRDYEANKLSYSARLARYKREFEAGLLRLLCSDCNLSERKKNDNGAFVPTTSVIERTIEIPF
jgi:hypothetical protein